MAEKQPLTNGSSYGATTKPATPTNGQAHSMDLLRTSSSKNPINTSSNVLLLYRMNELQAAIGSIQVGRLDGFLAKRKENYDILTEKLAGVDEIHQFESSNGVYQSSYYCKSIVLQGGVEKKRMEVIQALAAKGVGTSIYYPRPVPELTYYREKYGDAEGLFPEAAKIAYHSIALPVGPHLQPGDAEYAAEKVIETIKDVS